MAILGGQAKVSWAPAVCQPPGARTLCRGEAYRSVTCVLLSQAGDAGLGPDQAARDGEK